MKSISWLTDEYYLSQIRELKKESAKRLELLRRVEGWAQDSGNCPFCDSTWGKGVMIHANDCELAEALVSEQREDELGDEAKDRGFTREEVEGFREIGLDVKRLEVHDEEEGKEELGDD